MTDNELIEIEKRIAGKTATLEDFYRKEELVQNIKSEWAQKNCGTGICWYCGGRLCWDNDFDYSDVHLEGEGVVTELHCLDCGADAEFSQRTDEEE